MAVCFYCGSQLTHCEQTLLTTVDVWYVDNTGGDCCWGDDACNNENGLHTPTEISYAQSKEPGRAMAPV